MEEHLVKLCRTCGKKNFIFCNVHHEVMLKLVKLIPDLVRKVTFQLLFNNIFGF